MAVQPEIVPVQLPPPVPIRVTFNSSELRFVDVTVSVTVAGNGVAFRLGNKHQPRTDSAEQHLVRCDPDIDTVVYLHEWGDPAAMDEIEVIVEFAGTLRSATARVLPAALPVLQPQ
ncbi:MAG TPA: hypothetical protein VIM73_08505 [Polyangiaceae bacterium]